MGTRPQTVLPDSLSPPYPIVGEASIINGFGRGSSELGIPTANIPITDDLNKLDPGIYFGYSKLQANEDKQTVHKRQDGAEVKFNNGQELKNDELEILPMVMSIGYNPFYKNEQKTAELHIIRKFGCNFYGATIKYSVLGYVRPELDYVSKEALIEDINLDIKITLDALEKPHYKKAAELLH